SDAGEPVEPKVLVSRGSITIGGEVLQPRGVLFHGGTYRQIGNFNPLMGQSGFLGSLAQASPTPPPPSGAVAPALPVLLRVIEPAAQTHGVLPSNLLLFAGQYDPPTRSQFLFRELTVDEYYSASNDREPPTIQMVEATLSRGQVNLSVQATDGATTDRVARVVATYTDRTGDWRSVELSQAQGFWQGFIPAGVSYVVQAVDVAGNVTATAPAVAPRGYALYLPHISRRWEGR
ncbi:MAG: hypothetical protein KIT87_30135, partial [Anaerolineae bacterium]|nr:hypothetical protein [Anaerolineae bacterium]